MCKHTLVWRFIGTLQVHRWLIEGPPAYKTAATRAQERGIDEKPSPRDNRASVERARWGDHAQGGQQRVVSGFDST